MRRWTVGLGLGFAALAIATPAQAGTVTRSGTSLIYQATSGEQNFLQVRFFSGSVSLSDRYEIAPGAGCATDPVERQRDARRAVSPSWSSGWVIGTTS